MPVKKPAKLVMEDIAHDIVEEVARRVREQRLQAAVTNYVDSQKHDTEPSQEASSEPDPPRQRRAR